MTCHDVEILWNHLLDAQGAEPSGSREAIETHAAGCPACAEISRRYQTLEKAIAAMTAAPSVALAPGFRERVQAEVQTAPPTLPMRRIGRASLWLSAAAALVVASLIGSRFVGQGGRPPAEVARVEPERSLAESFADATSATLDLALQTSAPAGRVGRVVLSSTTLPGAESPLPLRVSTGISTSDVLQSVGGRVGAGVKPLSGSARQAFGFLIGVGSDTSTAPNRDAPGT